MEVLQLVLFLHGGIYAYGGDSDCIYSGLYRVGWGLGVPSIVAFVFGYPSYRNMDPSGSPFTRLVQVCVAAYKKRNLPMVSDAKMLYENEELDASISVAGRLLHTKQMK
ncbi:putative proton-dependent oligopeptide transporter family, MFS transporter superfamily [Helianthus debilis subsp. tardiflorus]